MRVPVRLIAHAVLPYCTVLRDASQPAWNDALADDDSADVSATVFSIQRLRIGARTNFAHRPAAIDVIAVAMNTAFHEPIDASTEASGTSIDAVPFAVYSVPALAAAYLLPKVSAQVAGKIEKISPQQRNVIAANSMKRYGLWPNSISPSSATPSPRKMMNIVFSRPILSEMKPHSGRVKPLHRLSMDSVMASSGSVTPRMLTGIFAKPYSLAIGPNCAVAITPPAATNT